MPIARRPRPVSRRLERRCLSATSSVPHRDGPLVLVSARNYLHNHCTPPPPRGYLAFQPVHNSKSLASCCASLATWICLLWLKCRVATRWWWRAKVVQIIPGADEDKRSSWCGTLEVADRQRRSRRRETGRGRRAIGKRYVYPAFESSASSYTITKHEHDGGISPGSKNAYAAPLNVVPISSAMTIFHVEQAYRARDISMVCANRVETDNIF